MRDRVCLVTGANTGIGLETARGLARTGATVVITSRDPTRGEAALEDLRRSVPGARVEMLPLDLASLASVREAARAFLARHERLHVLVNNAGLVVTDDLRTKDGFELTFGTNHLGHFLLTLLLLPALRASAPARIVNVSSDAHRSSRGLHFDALERGEVSGGWGAYGDSKLANILFTRELARRLAGTGVTVNALHPGVVNTRFAADGDTHAVFAFFWGLMRPFLLTPEKGARTSLYLATSPEVDGVSGRYFKECREIRPSRYAADDEAAARLWALSLRLVGMEATTLAGV